MGAKCQMEKFSPHPAGCNCRDCFDAGITRGLRYQCHCRPGATADIGVVEGKKFVIDQTVAFGTLQVVPDGSKNVLRFTAAPHRENVSEKVDCQIEGEPAVAVEVAIRPFANAPPKPFIPPRPRL